MSQQTAIAFVSSTIGLGLLGMSPALAAPANGTAIGEAATASTQLTQKVWWRDGVGWRGSGWRGVDSRAGWGWRPGLNLAAAGVATAGASYYAYRGYGYSNYGCEWRPDWRAGWGTLGGYNPYNAAELGNSHSSEPAEAANRLVFFLLLQVF